MNIIKDLKNIVINVRTQEEYNELMAICKDAGLEWWLREEVNGWNRWQDHLKNTCVEISEVLCYGALSYFKEKGYKIISFEEFMQMQKKTINKEMIKKDVILEFRNGEKRIVKEVTKEHVHIPGQYYEFFSFDSYSPDMKNKWEEEWDIVKIYSLGEIIGEREEIPFLEIDGNKVELNDHNKSILRKALGIA